jgi:hypothetical protein
MVPQGFSGMLASRRPGWEGGGRGLCAILVELDQTGGNDLENLAWWLAKAFICAVPCTATQVLPHLESAYYALDSHLLP